MPATIIKPLAIALDGADTFRQVRKLVTKQMHNVLTDMMEGDKAEPLFAVRHDQTNTETNTDKEAQDRLAAAEEDWRRADKESWAAAMNGKSIGGKGNGGKPNGEGIGLAGYGECYNCGGCGTLQENALTQASCIGEFPLQPRFNVQRENLEKGRETVERVRANRGYYTTNISLNYASESDYQAAWDTGSEWNPEEGSENNDYYDNSYNYNCGIWGPPGNSNNDHANNYSMLLTRTNRTPCKLSGSKCFTGQLLLHEDSDDDEIGDPDET